jgi:hypothetical protein
MPKLDSDNCYLFMPWLPVLEGVVTLVCHVNWMACPVVGIFLFDYSTGY